MKDAHMKLLITSDIHSNYEALLAVAHAEKPDEIWCLGDLVDYGPEPAEVVQWVRHCPLLVCEETSSLRRLCHSIERQLSWSQHKLDVIERKNRLLALLERRGKPVAFDHVARTAPRVARFIALRAEKVPIWVACRSDRANEIGHVWEHLYKFTRLEIAPFAAGDTGQFILETIAEGNIQPDAREHLDELHRMSEGNPRVLEELLMELT